MFIPYKIEEEHEYTGKPILTYTVIVLCVAIHIYLYKYSTEFFRNNVFYDYGVVPVDYRWWNSLSCTFLHGGILHLLGNMYFLWIYGRTCEKALGTIKFTLLYIIGAFVSVWAHVISITWFYADDPTIGASGAISAVLGAFLVMFPKTKVRLLVTTFGRPLPAFAPASFVLGFWFLMQIVYSLQLAGAVANVAFWAHIGGFAIGAVLGGLFVWLHNFSQAQDERKTAAAMMQAWQAFGSGSDPTPLMEALPNGIWQRPEVKRESKLNVLAAIFEPDHEKSYKLLHDQLERSVDRKEYGLAMLCYYYLVTHFREWELDFYSHRMGLSMAIKMNCIKIMACAYRHLSRSDDIDAPDRLLKAVAESMYKNGYIHDAKAVAAILREYFPTSNYTKECTV